VDRLTQQANEAHMKYCSNCGKEIEKPILFKGYVFCSNQCRESFTTPRGRGPTVRKKGRKWRSKGTKASAG
jgi:predicted nucleic acid-binding Zn ribbon protein